MSNTPASTDEKSEEGGVKLRGLGDVQREMSNIYRQMKSGARTIGEGNGLINALNCIAAIMMDQRDSLWTKRAKVMWEEREKHAQPTADH